MKKWHALWKNSSSSKYYFSITNFANEIAIIDENSVYRCELEFYRSFWSILRWYGKSFVGLSPKWGLHFRISEGDFGVIHTSTHDHVTILRQNIIFSNLFFDFNNWFRIIELNRNFLKIWSRAVFFYFFKNAKTLMAEKIEMTHDQPTHLLIN